MNLKHIDNNCIIGSMYVNGENIHVTYPMVAEEVIRSRKELKEKYGVESKVNIGSKFYFELSKDYEEE